MYYRKVFSYGRRAIQSHKLFDINSVPLETHKVVYTFENCLRGSRTCSRFQVGGND